MNSIFKQFIDNCRSIDDFNLKISYTDNQQILNLLNTLNQLVLSNKNYEQTDLNEWDHFFSKWIDTFSLLAYDELNTSDIESFPWKIEYPCYDSPIYCIFNISNLKSKIQFYEKTEISKNNIQLISYDDSITINSLFPVTALCSSILVETFLDPPYLLVDGNHRYINAINQNKHIISALIQFKNIQENMFINEFNFAIFLFVNTFQYLQLLKQSEDKQFYKLIHECTYEQLRSKFKIFST